MTPTVSQRIGNLLNFQKKKYTLGKAKHKEPAKKYSTIEPMEKKEINEIDADEPKDEVSETIKPVVNKTEQEEESAEPVDNATEEKAEKLTNPKVKKLLNIKRGKKSAFTQSMRL